MIERCQYLPLVPESLEKKWRVQAYAHNFDRHLFLVLAIDPRSAINLAHSAPADLLDDFVNSDPAADISRPAIVSTGKASQINCRTIEKLISSAFMGAEKRLYLEPQFGIALTLFL
jgi:hypothetical protein